MTGVLLYLRARRAPAALVGAAAAVWGLWAIWAGMAVPGEVPDQMGMAATGFAAIAAGTTLAGPDTHLDHTAARPWPPRRALHLAVAAAVILGLLLSVAGTAHDYGDAATVTRNCAGALGLITLGTATLGGARAWFYLAPFITVPPFLPLSRTSIDSTAGQILSWPLQPTTSTTATITAAVLFAAGTVAYIHRGPLLTVRH
ncbi:hypothetical protein [Actinoplanes couchii]|uniref:Uncharacterized protein n=1 Tax=Actinoplanes couchii TaxID=403638 RepID=A0ABQ3XTX0_9ACTN|nr:hypothetical protein [Actinoplanes couchii]MDR6319023.1 hypothetical protein [Actinoplanes couchii]GID61908.1 hypothetical protein Aco03nite_103120 [Actinoplanes couchii]